MKTLGRMILVMAVAIGLLGVVTTTARADDWHDHEKHAHDWHKRHIHHHGPVIVEEPNVVYAPPVIVEPPAPVVEESSPGLNIVIPLNFH